MHCRCSASGPSIVKQREDEKTPPASQQVGRWCAPRETRSPDERYLPPALMIPCRRIPAITARPPNRRPFLDAKARGSPMDGAHTGLAASRPFVRPACVASYRAGWKGLRFMSSAPCGSPEGGENENRAADVHPRARSGQVGPAAGSPRGGAAGGPSSIGTRLPGAPSLNATRSGCQVRFSFAIRTFRLTDGASEQGSRGVQPAAWREAGPSRSRSVPLAGALRPARALPRRLAAP